MSAAFQPVSAIWATPASFAQERMWFLEQLQPGSALYNIPVLHRFGRRSSRTVIERCLAALTDRHEGLRTSFRMEEDGLTQVVNAYLPISLEFADMRGIPTARREDFLAQAMEDRCRRPFDLSRGPLIRAELFRMGRSDDRLLIILHHIIADAWSVDILMGELRQLYEAFDLGRPAPLAPLRLQYADWAAWQRSQDRAAALGYWRRALDAAANVLELPTDRPRPAVATQRGATRHFALPADVAAAVAALATSTATSPFSVHLAAYALVLGGLSGVDDLLIGCPMTMRAGGDTEGIVGLFLNTLPLRVRLGREMTVDALLRELRQRTIEARDHASVPLEELIELVQPERSLQRHPLFQALFSYEGGTGPERADAPIARGGLGGPPPDTGTAKFELSLLLAQREGVVAGAWEYATDLFDEPTIACLESQYLEALRWMCSNSAAPLCELVMSGEEEIEAIARFERGAPMRNLDLPTNLSERFARQAARTPGAVALTWGSSRLTYGALLARAERLAGAIVAGGAAVEERIGILLPRGTDMVVAVLAVLRSGAAYVPIDPTLPAERIAHIVADGALSRVVATAELAERLPAGVAPIAPEASGPPPVHHFPHPYQAAYILYTSGSTGRPKGVVVPHRAVCAFLDWASGCFTAEDRRLVLASTSLSFDLSVFELFLPLTTGGTAVLAESVLALIEPGAPEVTLVNSVPSAIREVLRHWEPQSALRAVNLAGEPLPADLAAEIHSRLKSHVVLRNLYGPTETTTYSTYCIVPPGDPRPSIGRPIDGTFVRVLDEQGRRAAIGVAGELYIGGAGVARGYCGNPAQTADRYVPDPFAGEGGGRLYRTGDLARWSSAGALQFLGRSDNQVKLRGFRIELGEIEAVLREGHGVEEAVALIDSSRGHPRLVAFVTGSASAPASLAAALRRKLPGYMVPERIELVAAFPRTSSGKIDRNALRLSEPTSKEHAPPADARVAALCDIFAEVLGAFHVRPEDNFFELGGHSLLAVKVSAQIESKLGLKAPLGVIFAGRTPQEIAPLLDELVAARPSFSAAPESGDPVPLSRMQEGIYFFDRLQPGLPIYHMPVMIELNDVRLDLAQAATDWLAERHEALRLRFDSPAGRAEQVFEPELRIRVRHWTSVGRDSGALERAIEREIRRPFDLRRGPPVRATLMEGAAGRGLLLFVLHHIVGDGRSAEILVADFLEACRSLRLTGAVPTLPRPAGYLSFCRWQRDALRSERCTQVLAEMRDALAGVPPIAALPADRSRPRMPSYRGAHLWIDLKGSTTEAVATVARRLGVSPNLVYLSAFAILLGRMTGQAATSVGMPALNRSEAAWQETVGLFTNTMPIPLPAGEGGFAKLVDEVAGLVGSALDRAWLPFDMVVDALGAPRAQGCHPLFQVMYAYQEARDQEQLRTTPRASTGTSKFDLSLNIIHASDGGVALWEFSSDLYEEASIERLGRAYVALLEAALKSPFEGCAALSPFGDDLASWCARRGVSGPATEPSRARAGASARPPEGDLERSLFAIWREVLGHDAFDADSNFFEVGGNSLAAMIVGNRIAELGYQLPLEVIFTQGTIAALARESEAAGRPGDEDRDAVIAVDRNRGVPLSWAQERLLVLDRVNPGQAIYNIPLVVAWESAVDPAMLERAIERLADRHETLRSRFVDGTAGPEVMIDPILSLDLGFTDLSRSRPEIRAAEIVRIQRRTARRPFNLARGPLIRGHVVRIERDRSALFLCVHHIVADALSVPIFKRELREFYEAERLGDEPALPPLEAQFAEFAAWQRRRLGPEAKARHLDFWRALLEDAPPILALPTDRPRPPKPDNHGRQLGFALDEELTIAVRTFARRNGATPFAVLMSAYAMFLSAEAGVEDLVIGIPVAGRPHRLFEPLIGFFSNTLPLRLRPEPALTFAEFVKRCREIFLAALDHQDLPFEAIVQALNPERSMSHHPLFQTMFAFDSGSEDAPSSDLSDEREDGLLATAKFDLTLFVSEGKGFACALEYRSDLFDPETIRRFSQRFRDLLAAALASPDAPICSLNGAGPADLRLIETVNATERTFAEAEINCAALALGADGADTAVIGPAGETLNYADLRRRAAALADRIVQAGVGAGSRVAIAVEPRCELVVAVLAVWLARGTCVTLDPSYPRERIDFMVADSDAELLIGAPAMKSLAPSTPFIDWGAGRAEIAFNPPTGGSRDELAYLVYTSGSTGVPKAVAMPHGALVNLIRWQTVEGTREPLRTLQFVSPSFDVFYQEVLLTLATGGALCLVEPVIRRDPRLLIEHLRERGVGRLFLPFVALREIAEAGADAEPLPALREVITAGEQLQVTAALRSWFERHRGCRLVNQYGPAESHVVTEERLAPDPADWPSLPPIGRPIANTKAHVLDAAGNPCPIGIAGELHLSGSCLAQGYAGRPRLTAERFVPGGGLTGPGKRMYRTGDRARWLRDGRLAFLGRLDRQVKIRGYRVEPAEVERALHGLDGVAQAVVLVGGSASTPRLDAFVVSRSPGESPTGLREALARTLPEPLVPERIVPVAELPRTPSGKVDRRALADLADDLASAAAAATAPVPPGGIAEEAAKVWCDVLDRRDIDLETSFFAAGGHSLSAVRMISLLSRRLGVELPVSLVFDHPVLAGFAAVVQDHVGAAPLPGRRVIASRARDGGALPASWIQRRFWVLARIADRDPSYNLSHAVFFTDPGSRDVLADAILLLARRHEALRTRLREVDGELVQVVGEASEVPIERFDLDGFPASDMRAEFDAIVEDEARRGYDLARDPLFRAAIASLGDSGAVALLAMHHAVADGRSLSILESDLRTIHAALLEGEEPELPALAVQYADFAAREREALEGEALSRLVRYWADRIEDYPHLLQLGCSSEPADGAAAGRLDVRIGAEALGAMKRLAAANNCTLFAAAASVYAVLLSHLSGERRLLLGVPWGLRDDPTWDEVVGPFVNTLVLPFDLGGDPSFAGLLESARAEISGAHAHAILPFDKLVEFVRPERVVNANPLVQFAFGLHHTDLPAGGPVQPARGSAKFHASLVLFEAEDRLEGVLEYDRWAVSDSVAKTMAHLFEKIFARVAQHPDRSVWALLAEQAQASAERGAAIAAESDLPDLVARHGRRSPRAVAVEAPDGALDYARLEGWSNWLARQLRARQAPPETRVGVLIGNSRYHPLALVALLKAGMVYVPLDPALPDRRLRQIVAAAGIDLVLTTVAAGGALEDGPERWLLDGLPWRSAPPCVAEAEPGRLAYVLFTSGSTGAPKGVMITLDGMRCLLAAQAEILALAPADRLLKIAMHSFDAALFEMVLALGAGAALCLESEDRILPGRGLVGIIGDRRISAMVITPSSLALMPEEELPGLRLLCVAGEACPAEMVRRWAGGRRMLNLYGPTEATIWSTWFECADEQEPPAIGRPVPNLRLAILDTEMRPVADGGAGELFLGGPQVARGYLGDSSLTAEAFVPDPFGPAGSRLYRSGDLVRRRADGALEFLGRVDEQIKIRGVRIEPREIEAALLAQPPVADALAVRRDDPVAGAILVAYVVAREGKAVDPERLLARLAQALPRHMLPARIVPLAAFPRTASGKVAKNALPAPGGEGLARPASRPAAEREAVICDLCSALLGCPVSPDDNFFALGGHSLLVVRLISRLEDEFGLQVSARAIFDAANIGEFCAGLEKSPIIGDKISRLPREFCVINESFM